MSINISEMKDQLERGYQFVTEQGGQFIHRALERGEELTHLVIERGEKLSHHIVSILKFSLETIRQDVRWAGAVVAGSNIVFIEIAGRIAKLANDHFAKRLFGPEDKWTQKGALANSYFITLIVFSSVIGMNIALYKGLKPALNPLATGGLSTAACLGYIAFRLFKSSNP